MEVKKWHTEGVDVEDSDQDVEVEQVDVENIHQDIVVVVAVECDRKNIIQPGR